MGTKYYAVIDKHTLVVVANYHTLEAAYERAQTGWDYLIVPTKAEVPVGEAVSHSVRCSSW